jgi:ribosomal protein S18 acetylase RimI-like enzyme
MSLLQVLAHVRALQVRPVEAADRRFLRILYASTRSEELASTGWPPVDQQAFLAQQFDCQDRYYREHYADAEFLVLERAGCSIGRLYWHATPSALTLMDVSLLPEWRGGRIGTELMQRLTEHADQAGLPIGLHVEPTNPAHRLYQRFGFETVGDNGVYLKMRRPARQPAHPACEAVA